MPRRIWVLLFCVLLLSACSSVKKYLVMLPPDWSGMLKRPSVGGLAGVYTDADMSDARAHDLALAIQKARRRVIAVWGSVATAPVLFACSTEACFHRLGGTTNTAHSLGDRRIVLSPRGLDAGMIAHEWSHAEMYRRIGGLLAMLRVPRWFDEGVAVLTSRDARHGEGVWRKIRARGIEPRVGELRSRAQWSDAVHRYRDPRRNPDNLAVVYAAAGHRVAEWYARVGRAGLLHVIARVRAGEAFEPAWRALSFLQLAGADPDPMPVGAPAL
ncbi:MAG TPA: hypothetical protein ENJ21_01400 [Chromatiaceae bacterium]|nr:hypothetical protein [Chromatiaceae bacterium]